MKARVYRVPQNPYDPALLPCWVWRHQCAPALKMGGNGSLVPYEVGTWRAAVRGAFEHLGECAVGS